MKDDSLAGTSSASGSGTSNASVYYNALLDVPNPENRLRIAMTAQVSRCSAKRRMLCWYQSRRCIKPKEKCNRCRC